MKDIILDTNCLLICLPSQSKFHRVWTAFLDKNYHLCISNEIINEYEEVLAKQTSPAFADLIVQTILSRENTIRISPAYRFNLIAADPDDNKFVDCAIAANADYIVSQDAHFDILKTIDFPKINVIRIDDFTKELEQEKN
ncbi:MAG: putative toxin-antitoxin system toxin component, PIN family [Prevotellaceae bacterium]|jgi:putative PIN family toxin of toxin-antitoxin system|nr:putative toxin-antitoxin system toxin component, PIN family [Prevotellaceae bacterium]